MDPAAGVKTYWSILNTYLKKNTPCVILIKVSMLFVLKKKLFFFPTLLIKLHNEKRIEISFAVSLKQQNVQFHQPLLREMVF